MAKKLADPIVRISFVTSNNIQLVIESYPDPNMSSSRWDARVIGYDFNDIRTNVYLSDVCTLIKDISELEESDEVIRNDALSYFHEDTDKLINALGCTADDLQQLRTTIVDSRNQVFQNKEA